jgi:riboflavin kinase / FMN adenylyltransferase
MRIFRHTSGLPDTVRGGVVTIGNFDGVHLGHQEVIGEAAREAARRGAPMTVVTFEPHPRRFFRAEDPPFELTPLRSKVRWLQALGVETLQLVHFDMELSQASAADFVQRLLVDGLDARHVVVGYDFVFGHGRQGDIDMLRGLSDDGAFGFTAVDPVSAPNGQVYSSTNIRGYLRDGDPMGAAGLLGRCWEIEGRVQTGDQRGRTIGFPTANIPIDDYVEPALGVYAVWAGIERDGATEWHMGSANIGHRPTFNGEGVVIEVYLFDFTDDIYNQLLRVALVDYIRPERKFDGIPQLREQIALDCGVARKLLESIRPDDIRRPPDRSLNARDDGN